MPGGTTMFHGGGCAHGDDHRETYEFPAGNIIAVGAKWVLV